MNTKFTTAFQIQVFLEQRFEREKERLRIAKDNARACGDPDDLVDFAARFKAQAARVNLLEDLLYEIGEDQ
jgi:hypothetical protein